MREILFRGKTITSKEWIYGDLLQYAGGAQIWENTEQGKFNAQIIPETVGQYTGLTDKNGTRIFEKDILKNTLDNSISVVEWSEAHTGFIIKTRGTIYGFPKMGHEVYKIIGNIYDNPELLEESK